jgi:hypothetical protein
LYVVKQQSDIPVRLGDELLSYEEVNVFTLAIFYKFAVHLATKYLEFAHPTPGKSHDANAHATAIETPGGVKKKSFSQKLAQHSHKLFTRTRHQREENGTQ